MIESLSFVEKPDRSGGVRRGERLTCSSRPPSALDPGVCTGQRGFFTVFKIE